MSGIQDAIQNALVIIPPLHHHFHTGSHPTSKHVLRTPSQNIPLTYSTGALCPNFGFEARDQIYQISWISSGL